MVLWHQGKRDEAKQRFEQAIALRPAYPEAHNNLGNILWGEGELGPAAASFERAIALRPDYPDAHNNLGITLWHQGKLAEAQARLQHAIALWPDYAEAHSNLGIVLWHQGNLDGARTQYQQVLALRPDYADAQRALASCYLVSGDFQRGWPAYESRLRLPGVNLDPSLPRWTGQPLAGRRLLLLAEQGLGDTLQFVRYARALRAMGARIVLLVPPALGRLLESHPDIDELIVIGSAENLAPFDFYLPLLSVPAALGTTEATIPRDIPYLWADPELTERRGRSCLKSRVSRSGSPGRARGSFAAIVGVRSRWPSLLRWPACPACSSSACKRDSARSRSRRSIFRCSIFPTGSTRRPAPSWTRRR